MLVAEHLAKSETVSITLNKANFTRSGIAFADIASVLPCTLVDDVSGVKAFIDWDEEAEEFILDLNGEPFENLVFLDDSFSLEDTETKVLNATVTINDEIISEAGCEW